MEELKQFWSVLLPLLFEALNTTPVALTDDEASSRLNQSDRVIAFTLSLTRRQRIWLMRFFDTRWYQVLHVWILYHMRKTKL